MIIIIIFKVHFALKDCSLKIPWVFSFSSSLLVWFFSFLLLFVLLFSFWFLCSSALSCFMLVHMHVTNVVVPADGQSFL